MKLLAKLLAVAAMAVGLNAYAADQANRKELALDTGDGGIHLTVSVPGYAKGPYDFAANPGRQLVASSRLAYGELMYRVASDTAVKIFEANVIRRIINEQGVQPITADHLANEMIKHAGLKGQEQKIDCPPPPFQGATMSCYKLSGVVKFGSEPAEDGKSIAFLIAVSFANDTQGYTLMATIHEKNTKAFDADQAKYERATAMALKGMFENSEVSKGNDLEMKQEHDASPKSSVQSMIASTITIKAKVSEDKINRVKWQERVNVEN